MAKITNPQDIFPQIEETYKNIFGDSLISIILFGSASGGDYIPGKSDINFLIILSEDAIDNLESALDEISRWRKRKVATPLFMTKAYITSSLDSYPIEFLNIKRNHLLVYGEDVLEEITFDPHDLRLQCEREIKGKLLLLREGFLETGGKKRKIRELISTSITAFISIFSGLLHLKGIEIPNAKRDIIRSVAQEFSIDSDPFLKCMDIRAGERDFSAPETGNIFKTYLAEVRKLWEIVDKMEI
ncbi:MAG: nucleotidyltransferase domain-containing protein [Thermodesulfobacteriota bacterium]|nr:nucleotidyltransferase domain-containing protein [Thermodesulfobacteriota bacterium]